MFPMKNKALLRQQCYINGQWTDASSGATIAVTNPADGAVLGRVPDMGRGEIAAAIDCMNSSRQSG